MMVLKTDSVTITINQSVIDDLTEYQSSGSFEVEAGGILIGVYDTAARSYCITDITWPQRNDKRQKYRFIRSEFGHQDAMDALWEQSNYRKSYLGEWHTHNQLSPTPSPVDYMNWKKIAKRNRNFDEVFFLIMGLKHIGLWTLQNNSFVRMDELQP